jgi:membrane protease YdiL (CAAX protease family)
MLVLQVGVAAVRLIGNPEGLQDLMNGSGVPNDLLVPMLLIGNTGAFLFVLLLGWRLSRERLSSLFPFRMSPIYLAIFLPLLVSSVSGAFLISELDNAIRMLLPQGIRDFMGLLDRSMFNMIRESYWPAVAALVVMAPFTEELFFRGLLLHGFRRRYGMRKAVVASAAFFSLAHLAPNQLVPAFLAGIFLAWLLLRTRSLWMTVFTHAAFNGTAAVSVGLALRSGESEPSLTPELQPWYLDATMLLILAVGIAATVFLVRRFHPDSGEPEV